MSDVATITKRTFDEVFTEKERQVIDICLVSGQFDSVPSALESAGFFDFTQEKELVLQEYLNAHRPVSLESESAVMNELQKKEMEGYKIETPEQEKYWQEKIDAERAEKLAKLRDEKSDTQSPTTQSPIAQVQEGVVETTDDLNEIEMTKAEVMEELKKRNVDFKPAQSKAELVDLLAASKPVLPL